jgi:hypothetical protein
MLTMVEEIQMYPRRQIMQGHIHAYVYKRYADTHGGGESMMLKMYEAVVWDVQLQAAAL